MARWDIFSSLSSFSSHQTHSIQILMREWKYSKIHTLGYYIRHRTACECQWDMIWKWKPGITILFLLFISFKTFGVLKLKCLTGFSLFFSKNWIFVMTLRENSILCKFTLVADTDLCFRSVLFLMLSICQAQYLGISSICVQSAGRTDPFHYDTLWQFGNIQLK